MSHMFSGCSSLNELNLNNFNTNNVTDMAYMFYKCSSLKELNINNFNINNLTFVVMMFSKCSDELKNKIRNLGLNIKEEAFKDRWFWIILFIITLNFWKLASDSASLIPNINIIGKGVDMYFSAIDTLDLLKNLIATCNKLPGNQLFFMNELEKSNYILQKHDEIRIRIQKEKN